MSTEALADDPEVLDFLWRIGKSVHRQFPTVHTDDCYQQSWLWALEHEKTFRSKWADNRNYLWSSIRNEVAKWARRERAGSIGGDSEDDYFYSVPELRSLLLLAFTPDWVEKGQAYDRQPTGNGISDPADLWAKVADVKAAFRRLSDRDRGLLATVFAEPGDWKTHITEQARLAGVTDKVMDQRVRDALGRMRKRLGGAKPRTGGDDAE